MKRNIRFIIIGLVIILGIQNSIAYTYYTDSYSHWSEPYIDWATNEVKLFEGYGDGTFRPDNNITRAEFIVIISRLMKIQIDSFGIINAEYKLGYNDLDKNFWGHDHIYRLANFIKSTSKNKIDITSVFPGNNIKPNEPINRYEAAVLTSLITPPQVQVTNLNFKDLSNDVSFYNEIAELASAGIIKGYPDGTFRPWNNITRAEAATILKNAHKELEYLKTDMLKIRSIDKLNLNKKLPLFEYEKAGFNQLALDKRFINAVRTLDYISFIKHIPYSERHLYDSDPINTLWELKNENYYNVVGTNFYLISFDKALIMERKVELIRESLEHYEGIDNTQSFEGITELINVSKEIIPVHELIMFFEKNLSNIKDTNEKIIIGTFLAEYYNSIKKYDKALLIYKDIINISNNMELRSHLILNKAFLIYKSYNPKEAVKFLIKSWDELKDDVNYNIHKESIDYLFNSMIKQLKMK